MFQKLLFTITVSLFMYNLAMAQDGGCTQTFESIDASCIQSLSANFDKYQEKEKRRLEYLENAKAGKKGYKLPVAQIQKDLVFILKKDDIEKLQNTIFLYRTKNGILGKLLVKKILLAKNQCTMLVQSSAYERGGRVDKMITFMIENRSSSWNADRATLGNNTGSNFILRRVAGNCVFKTLGTDFFKLKTLEAPAEEEGDTLLLYAGYFLIGLALFLIARTVFQDEDRYKAQEKLEDVEGSDKQNEPTDIVLKYSRPFFKRYFSPVVQGMKNKRKIKEKYKRPLASSGLNKYLTPEDFFAFKLFLIIGFPIVYLGLRIFLEEDWPLIYLPFISIGGFFYPDLWIKGKIDQRRQNVIENMPFVVDMLALSVEAGLDFVAAMQKVIEKAPPSALVDEFEILIKETKVGASRAEGLRQLAWRIDALPVSSFCATLIAADSVGANISPILKTLAQELREKRSSLIEQKGAQAATKILIPMIFFVLPATLLVIMAPIVLQLVGAS